MKPFATVESSPDETAEFQKAPSAPGAGSFSLPQATRIFLILFGVITFAYVARPVVLPLMLAWIASMTLKPPVIWLRKLHLPTPLAAGIVLGFFLIVLGIGAMWLGRPAVEWFKSAPEQVQPLRQKYKNVLQPFLRFSAAASNVENLAEPGGTNAVPQPVAVKDNHMVGTVFTWTSSLLAGIAEAIVLTFLLLASGDGFMQKFAQAMPSRQHKKRAVEIGREIQHSISKYLFTVSLINVGLGCAVGLGFWLVGMPNAAMWGGVAAILNFLPFFGPTMGVITVGIAGLMAFDTLGGALIPVAVYLPLHLTESYFVTPYALGQRFSLNPVIIFIAFIFFIWLWGVIGALLAVPLLVSIKVICERVPALMPLAEFL